MNRRTHTIFCIRHGRPGLRYSHTPWRWLTAGEMNGLLDAYDAVGLHPEWNAARLDEMKNAIAAERWHAITTAHSLSSDLPRAFETALLYTRRDASEVPSSSIYRETPLARFRWTGLKLPTMALLALVRLGWYTGWMQCTESRTETHARVRAAADQLEQHAADHHRIAVYSHGFFLWLLGRELRRRGWHSTKTGPYRYLEPAEFQRPVG